MKNQKIIAIILILLLSFLSFSSSYAQVNNEALKFAIKQKAFEIAVGKSLIYGGIAVSSYNTMKEIVSDTITSMGDTATEFKDSFINETTNTIKLWGVVGNTVWSGVKSVVSNIIDRFDLTEDSTTDYLPEGVVSADVVDVDNSTNLPSGSISVSSTSTPNSCRLYVTFAGTTKTLTSANTSGKTLTLTSKTFDISSALLGGSTTFITNINSYHHSSGDTVTYPVTFTITSVKNTSNQVTSIKVDCTGFYSTGTLSKSFDFSAPATIIGTIGYTYNDTVYNPTGTITAKSPAFNPSWDFENKNTKSREVAVPLPKEILSVNEGVRDAGLNLDDLTTKELEDINNTLEKEYSELHTKTIEDLTFENALEGVPEFVGETTIDGISSIFDLLNPFSDTFILKLAFVPSLSLADFFVDVKNLFFNQFPFIPQIITAFESLDGAFTPFSNYNTKPDDITIDLPSFAGGQTVTLLSFDLYSNYRDYIFMFIRAITWTYFITKTFKKVSFIFAKH